MGGKGLQYVGKIAYFSAFSYMPAPQRYRKCSFSVGVTGIKVVKFKILRKYRDYIGRKPYILKITPHRYDIEGQASNIARPCTKSNFN